MNIMLDWFTANITLLHLALYYDKSYLKEFRIR